MADRANIPTVTPSCGRCAFFVGYSNNAPTEGRCHRFPPVAFKEGFEHPEVWDSDWCREFRTYDSVWPT